MADRGGMVLRTGQEHRFLPADVATVVVPAARVVPVPGLVIPAVGLVLTEDRVATVLQVGTLVCDHMVVCEIEGGSVALAGAKVVATGVFPATEDGRGVLWDGAEAADLDVGLLTHEVEEAIWRASGLGHDERQQ